MNFPSEDHATGCTAGAELSSSCGDPVPSAVLARIFQPAGESNEYATCLLSGDHTASSASPLSKVKRFASPRLRSYIHNATLLPLGSATVASARFPSGETTSEFCSRGSPTFPI